MYPDNEKISERQGFRIGILENIAVGMVITPFITINVAGNWHFLSLIIGMIMAFVYSMIIFAYSKCFPEGFINALNDNLGVVGKLFDIVYILRYIVRASLILLFFGMVIREYLLRSYNMWFIIIAFVIICGYGASRDIEKRGRLMELLYWWMVVPLIIVAVFSISNIDWGSLTHNLKTLDYSVNEGGITSTFQAGYLVLIVLSTIELMMFSLSRQKENNWKNALKIIIWILVSVLFAYIFIIGILGGLWAGSSSTAALNVMEASAFPGGTVERVDYPVLAFWIIGIFAVVSGYMFYAKEFAGKIFRAERPISRWWVMLAIILLVILEVWGWGNEIWGSWMAWYLIWVDLAVSIVVPLIVLFVRKLRMRRR